MGFELFRDLIDALGKVMSGIKILTDLSKAERQKLIQQEIELYEII